MRPVTERKAEEIGQALAGSGFTFDPTVIIAIIMALITLFKGCKLTPAQAAARCQRPKLLDIIRLRRAVHQYASVEHEAVAAAFLDAGEVTTPTEVTDLYAENP